MVSRSARYYLLGEPSPAVRQLWIVLHGYGQLAARFLRHCDALAAPDRLVVAPEALSRFYRDAPAAASHAAARVGATWMTREDRLAEINDYVSYLDLLHVRLSEQLGAVELRVLGFSQGAATAARWAVLGRARPTHLVLWGGAMPEDLDLEQHRDALAALQLTCVTGDADPLRDAAAVATQVARLTHHGVPCRSWSFAGGHHLDEAMLRRLALDD